MQLFSSILALVAQTVWGGIVPRIIFFLFYHRRIRSVCTATTFSRFCVRDGVKSARPVAQCISFIEVDDSLTFSHRSSAHISVVSPSVSGALLSERPRPATCYRLTNITLFFWSVTMGKNLNLYTRRFFVVGRRRISIIPCRCHLP